MAEINEVTKVIIASCGIVGRKDAIREGREGEREGGKIDRSIDRRKVEMKGGSSNERNIECSLFRIFMILIEVMTRVTIILESFTSNDNNLPLPHTQCLLQSPCI